jgi:tRNA A37 threonylcarbamoyladenosine modification protein TsaB
VPALLIDASSPTLFVGAYEDGAWLLLKSAQMNALEGLFDLSKEVFQVVPLEKCNQLVFCEGPGRLMSLRISAVAANQWAASGKEKFAYNSLQAASMVAGSPVGVELRQGAYAVWLEGKIEVLTQLPAGAQIFSPAIQEETIANFPKLAKDLAREVPFFDPPLWAPIEYKKV